MFDVPIQTNLLQSFAMVKRASHEGSALPEPVLVYTSGRWSILRQNHGSPQSFLASIIFRVHDECNLQCQRDCCVSDSACPYETIEVLPAAHHGKPTLETQSAHCAHHSKGEQQAGSVSSLATLGQ